tara:strand:- start:893 stop:1660 length:768 start_codon:yes stop_codon:yes gene_type:complete
MLKKRVIPVLLLKNGRMVKGKNFNNYIDTGDPNKAVDIYSSQDADELIFINISKDIISKKKFLKILNRASQECSMPLCAGGGITSSKDVKELLEKGADKVLVNSILTKNLDIIEDISVKFGAQCIVAGIDYKINKSSKKIEVWSECGTNLTSLDFYQYIEQITKLGVGEIFLNSIDHDGLMRGYDLTICKIVSEKFETPLIVSGGAGNFTDLINIFTKTQVSAAACASLFHFNDYNPIQIRSYLNNNGVKMRKLK